MNAPMFSAYFFFGSHHDTYMRHKIMCIISLLDISSWNTFASMLPLPLKISLSSCVERRVNSGVNSRFSLDGFKDIFYSSQWQSDDLRGVKGDDDFSDSDFWGSEVLDHGMDWTENLK